MTFTFKLSRRLALIFAAVAGGALVGCSIDDPSGTTPFVPQYAIGDTLFSDGFESGTLAWDDNFRASAKTIVAAAARTGTRGLRVTYAPGSDGGTLSKFVARGDRLYLRAAVRFPSTWTGGTGLLTLRAAPASNQWGAFGTGGLCPSGSAWAVTGAWANATNLDFVFNTYFVGMRNVGGQCLGSAGLPGDVSTGTYTPPLAMSKGEWHVVEIEAQLNAVGQADGWQKIWLDGTLRGSWAGLTFRTTNALQWNAVTMELATVGVTQTQALDIDDVLVGRQRPDAAPLPVAVASVQVAPATATLNAGATLQLTATPRDASGNALTNRVVTWSSSNAAVATVSATGAVTALAPGAATITATSEGQTGSAAVTVPAPPPTGQVLFSEGFDDPQFGARGWYDFTGTPAVTTADKHSGAGALQIQWAAGSTVPPMKVMRRLFTATDRLYVSYWVKYSTNYVGSGRSYHPHEFNVLSNQDQDYDGLTYNYLNTYIEQNYRSGGMPRLSIQDSRMIDVGRIGVNLTNVTEQRSIGGCNGNSDGTGVTECYQTSATQWYNLKVWDAAAVAFQPSPGTDYKGNWNRVEVELRLNSVVGGIGQKDGVVRYWLNGNLKLERTNVMFRTGANPNLKFRQFLISPYIGDGSPVTQTMWLDDLTIGTSRDGETVPPATPAPVATVTVTPASATVAIGATAQLNAVTRDAAGATLTGRVVTWTTSAPTIATVVNGLVTGLVAGQATITATSEGKSGTATITVPVVPPLPVPVATVVVTPAVATLTTGATTQLTATTRDASGNVLTGRSTTWSSSNASAATVNGSGLVTAVATGVATITATSEGRSGAAAITVTPLPPGGGDPNPAFDLKFGGYANTAALQSAIQSGATPWLGEGSHRELDKITRITGVSIGGRPDLTTAMRYTWGLAGRGAAQYTIRSILDPKDLPAGSERWVEVWARFSNGFTNAPPGGPDYDYKFLLFVLASGGRWNVQMLGQGGGNTQWGYPNHEDAWTSGGNGSLGRLSGGAWSSSNVWDGQWHRHRFHLKFGNGNGVATWYVDGRAIHVANNLTISGSFGEFFVGANMNVGPTQVQTLDWANIRIWTSNPGWGF